MCIPKPLIVILLSSYNGSIYLREQLESILHQSNVDVKIIVRDDGSTDETLNILQEYENVYPDIFTIIKGENIGWKKSFFSLLNYANKVYRGSYTNNLFFAFSDQDDVWLPSKLEKAVEGLAKLPNGANLYASNLNYYKEGVNHGIVSIRKSPKYKEHCLVRNLATGCTIVFNQTLLNLVGNNLPTISVPHDYWLYQVATLCGHSIIDKDSYILYRQHENNQIGSKISRIEIWKRRFGSLPSFFKNHNRSDQAKELLRLFGDQMPVDSYNGVCLIANYRRSINKKIQLLFNKNFTTGLKANDRWLKIRIIFSAL